MNMACEKRYERLIDQMLLEQAPGDWQKLRHHLHGCEPCRDRYNRVVHAERMLHGGPEKAFEPSPLELDRICGAVLPVEKSAWQRTLQWFRPTHYWAASALAAAAIFLLIPMLSNQPLNTHPPEPKGSSGPVELFQARGGVPAEARQAGLRAFCLEGDKVEPLESKGSQPPRCERSSQLKLAVSNPGSYKSVFLVGMDDDHAPKWYAPKPPGAESVPAPAGIQDQPVGGAVKIGINHGPGRVRIFALFSDKPVRAPEVESAVDELAKRHVSAAEAQALPLKRPDVLQRSLLVDVTE
jgi:hypothetical protein